MTPVSVPLLKCHKDLWQRRGAAGNCWPLSSSHLCMVLCIIEPTQPTFAPEKNFRPQKLLKIENIWRPWWLRVETQLYYWKSLSVTKICGGKGEQLATAPLSSHLCPRKKLTCPRKTLGPRKYLKTLSNLMVETQLYHWKSWSVTKICGGKWEQLAISDPRENFRPHKKMYGTEKTSGHRKTSCHKKT